jgi:glyoxylase-like metal-dependent hydrolase (beta-lactamase superfamily II)
VALDYYSFKVGTGKFTVLLDGVDSLSRERFLKRFPDASEPAYRRAFADLGLSFDEAISSLNVLCAKIGDETILVDAGEAGKPRGGELLASMCHAGIAPDDITLIVLTHSHGDHVQGLLTDEGQPAFPNARYVISAQEMAFWQKRIENGKAAEQRAIVTMMETRGLQLIAMDAQIVPGVAALPIPGHTPGQIALLFESDGEALIHMADLLHSPIQFPHPEWSAYFDADTSVSVPTRRAALGLAADEGALTAFYHLAFPGVGRIRRGERGFIWEPIEA